MNKPRNNTSEKWIHLEQNLIGKIIQSFPNHEKKVAKKSDKQKHLTDFWDDRQNEQKASTDGDIETANNVSDDFLKKLAAME